MVGLGRMTVRNASTATQSRGLALLFGAGLLLVAIGGVQRCAAPLVTQKEPAKGTPSEKEEGYEPEPLPPMSSGEVPMGEMSSSGEQAATTIPEPGLPHDTEIERIRLMDEQVHLMRVYSGLHGPDDPASLTEEEIEAFRKRGNPHCE
jgi:hypothetical protein